MDVAETTARTVMPLPVSRRLGRYLRNGVSALTMCALLSGCANVQSSAEETFGRLENSFANMFGNYIDASDECVDQRRRMVDSAALFDQDTLKIVAVSIGVGLLTGLVTRDWRKGLIAGAATLAVGYIGKLATEDRSSTEVTMAMRSDVQKSNEKIDQVLAAFRDIDRCRRGQASKIRADLGAKIISREVAVARMTEVRERRAEDVEKFRELAANISESTATYATAYNEIAADNGQRGFEVQETGKIKRTKRAPKAKSEINLAGAKKSEVRRLERDCLTNIRKRDECFEVAEKASEEQGDFQL